MDEMKGNEETMWISEVYGFLSSSRILENKILEK